MEGYLGVAFTDSEEPQAIMIDKNIESCLIGRSIRKVIWFYEPDRKDMALVSFFMHKSYEKNQFIASRLL